MTTLIIPKNPWPNPSLVFFRDPIRISQSWIQSGIKDGEYKLSYQLVSFLAGFSGLLGQKGFEPMGSEN